MNPIKKRKNPFDSVINEEITPELPIQQQPRRAKPIEEKRVSYQQERVQTPSQPVASALRAEEVREKYTSTMARTLRKQVKIACVNKGVMFAQFVEEACREKLDREGMK